MKHSTIHFAVICKHCGKPIKRTMLIGLSLICPSCRKPQHVTILSQNARMR